MNALQALYRPIQGICGMKKGRYSTVYYQALRGYIYIRIRALTTIPNACLLSFAVLVFAVHLFFLFPLPFPASSFLCSFCFRCPSLRVLFFVLFAFFAFPGGFFSFFSFSFRFFWHGYES